MKQLFKKIAAWILILAFVTGTIPVTATAAETSSSTEATEKKGKALASFEKIEVNPLYEDVITEEWLTSWQKDSSKRPTLNAASEEDALLYYDIGNSALELLEGMVQRERTVYVGYATDDLEGLESGYYADLILALAMEHNGTPVHGDYILWQLAGVEYAGNLYYTEEEGIYGMIVEYTLSYYTTQEQEIEMDEAVTALLDELDVYTLDDYSKVKAVYDYICENVTYDHDNLYDDTYTLKYTPYAALINGTAVCQGYAGLLYRLCLELGVDTRLIPGDGDGDDHGWNIIQMDDGLYYNADSTWDAGMTEYEYFLKCDDNFPSHTRWEEYATEEFYDAYPMGEEDYFVCTDHVWILEEDKAPNCVSPGFKTYVCEICGESYKEEVEPTGHSYDEGSVFPPTCEGEGYTMYICEVCNHSYNTDIVPPLGHEALTEATDNADGKTHHGICSACGLEIEEDHIFVEGFCSVCGAEEPALETPEMEYIYSKLQTTARAKWKKVEQADGYELYRATSMDAPEEEWVLTKTIRDGSTLTYTNTGLEEGVTYYYKVRAYRTNSFGVLEHSEFSNIKYMPAAVVFQNVYSNSTFRARILWNEINGADGYQIWRKDTEDGEWKVVKTLGDKGNELTNDQGDVTAYSNTGLEAGSTYVYKMRAFAIPEPGTKVFGAYSDEFKVSIIPEAVELTVTSPKEGRALLQWTPVNGAAGYQVWMSETEDGQYSIVKSVTDTSADSYTKYDLTSGKTYYFKVRVYSEADGRKAFAAFSETVSIVIK